MNWAEATNNPPFSIRSRHSAIAFDGKLWVIGGYHAVSENDVWFTTDGVNWTEATSNAAFLERDSHQSLVSEACDPLGEKAA